MLSPLKPVLTTRSVMSVSSTSKMSSLLWVDLSEPASSSMLKLLSRLDLADLWLQILEFLNY